jgi:hypothetical protein
MWQLTDFLKTILPTNALQVIFIQPFVIEPHAPTSASSTVDRGTTKRSLEPLMVDWDIVLLEERRRCDQVRSGARGSLDDPPEERNEDVCGAAKY